MPSANQSNEAGDHTSPKLLYASANGTEALNAAWAVQQHVEPIYATHRPMKCAQTKHMHQS